MQFNIATFCTIMLAVTAGVRLDAAELRLKSECQPSNGLVHLGDIAEVFANEPAEARDLAGIDLLAAPAAGQKRTLRVRELQDLLALRGVNLAAHRFSGASQVTINGAKEELRTTTTSRSAPAPAKKSATMVREAVARYLQDRQPDHRDWQVKLELDEQQSQTIGATKQPLLIEGGASPWTGTQQFVISCTLADGIVRMPVIAQVSLPPNVVVATKVLARGTIIRSGDVQLQPGLPAEGSARIYQALEDVIGKETTQVVTAGQILDDGLVRQPLLVRRGEIVTVYARSAGIQVRTTARARDDGALGDLVTVESLADRKSFFARVCGPQEVDVFGHAVQTAPEPQARSSAPAVRRPTGTSASVVRFNNSR